ncbi:MAG: hypothetical protein RJA57_1542 [Bacteroidota bacterium]
MIADLLLYKNGGWMGFDTLKNSADTYQLLLIFGERRLLTEPDVIPPIAQVFTNARSVACSTAGEIYGGGCNTDTVFCLALSFDKTRFEIVEDRIARHVNSFELGRSLARQLPSKELSYVMVLSDGALIVGDELIEGMNTVFDPSVTITGAMAGDGARFGETLTGTDGNLSTGNVVLIGFYGSALQVSSGVKGGWTLFGPERTITRSEGNELFEIDGENALTLYKRYLGEYARELPGSALFFPIAILKNSSDDHVVRTILHVDEATGSMRFAGKVPVGSRIRLMRTNTDDVIHMAGNAAADARVENPMHISRSSELALIFNCIGRRLVLDARANDEIKAITDQLNPHTLVAGFYSYGEFSKRTSYGQGCELHNQTVVVTLLYEN